MTCLPRVIQIFSSRARLQISRSGSEPLPILRHHSTLQVSSGTNFYLINLEEKQSLKSTKQSAASASHSFVQGIPKPILLFCVDPDTDIVKNHLVNMGH